jgi:hypothetical protein
MDDPATDEGKAAEFPKMLYVGGHVRDEAGRPVRHDFTRLVHDADEEAEARAEGFEDAVQGEAAQDDAPLGDGEHEGLADDPSLVPAAPAPAPVAAAAPAPTPTPAPKKKAKAKAKAPKGDTAPA